MDSDEKESPFDVPQIEHHNDGPPRWMSTLIAIELVLFLIAVIYISVR